MSILEEIDLGRSVKSLTIQETDALSREIREKIIEVTSRSGGHLASNLGAVELTVALHRCFDLPRDSIVFDVGHQCYAHKLLTGRYRSFDTLRREGGISGFTNRSESEYDAFGAGHSGTSVSAALGIARAKRLDGRDDFTVAVVGDGSFTNGMIYEALNNCADKDLKLIIILNDNEMSISKNVGSISNYLSSFTNTKGYIKFKDRLYHFFTKLPGVGGFFLKVSRKIKNFVKRLFFSKNYFEILGLKYFGVIDGHDVQMLETVIEHAKKLGTPCVIHVATKKGKGYPPAEERPDLYHSVGPFDAKVGVIETAKTDFSTVFGSLLAKKAEADPRVVAVTAAMGTGTGLKEFEERFPERFFDVGIAEEHAVTFCAGLASAGKRPVFAVYSSFLQRGYDQLIHDVAIQRLPVVFAIDRSGFVPGDGVTHQGIYDTAFLLGIPGMSVYAPENYAELEKALDAAMGADLPSAIRYPKGGESGDYGAYETKEHYSVARFGETAPRLGVVTYGRVSRNVYKACEALGKEFGVVMIKLGLLSPLPEGVEKELAGVPYVAFVDEGVKSGGAGEHTVALLAQKTPGVKFAVKAIEDEVAHTGSVDELYSRYGFDPGSLEKTLSDLVK